MKLRASQKSLHGISQLESHMLVGLEPRLVVLAHMKAGSLLCIFVNPYGYFRIKKAYTLEKMGRFDRYQPSKLKVIKVISCQKIKF